MFRYQSWFGGNQNSSALKQLWLALFFCVLWISAEERWKTLDLSNSALQRWLSVGLQLLHILPLTSNQRKEYRKKKVKFWIGTYENLKLGPSEVVFIVTKASCTNISGLWSQFFLKKKLWLYQISRGKVLFLSEPTDSIDILSLTSTAHLVDPYLFLFVSLWSIQNLKPTFLAAFWVYRTSVKLIWSRNCRILNQLSCPYCLISRK